MSDDKNKQEELKQTNDANNKQELADEELDNVAGGFNPQPDPPGVIGKNPIDPSVRKAGKEQQEY